MLAQPCACRPCRESVAINSSLMTLGRCLEALRWNQQHRGGALRVVPYRESKVTHLFRCVWGGGGACGSGGTAESAAVAACQRPQPPRRVFQGQQAAQA
jgi:hypothetical protein